MSAMAVSLLIAVLAAVAFAYLYVETLRRFDIQTGRLLLIIENGRSAMDEPLFLLRLQERKYKVLADAAPAGSGARKAALETVRLTREAIEWYETQETPS